MKLKFKINLNSMVMILLQDNMHIQSIKELPIKHNIMMAIKLIIMLMNTKIMELDSHLLGLVVHMISTVSTESIMIGYLKMIWSKWIR